MLSTEAQRILDGIRDFSLPFDLGLDSDDENVGDGNDGATSMSPPQTSQRVGNTPMPSSTAAAKKVSHSMACGDDEPISEADLREAPPRRYNGVKPHSSPTSKDVGVAGTSSSSAVGGRRSVVSSGVGGSVGRDDDDDNDSGLVGFNVNPLMRRGRDENGHFTDIMVMEQRITLLPQFEARGGPLLQAAAHDHIPEVTESTQQQHHQKQENIISGNSTSNKGGGASISKSFLESVRRAVATYQPTRPGGGKLMHSTGVYFTHLMMTED